MTIASAAREENRIGHFDLLTKIGEGAAGTVYKARDRRSGEVVALKVMQGDLARNSTLRARFEQEFRAANRLDHPNIVRALDFGDNGISPFLVMEFVEGESLGERLEHQGRLAEPEAVRIILQVCAALVEVHRHGIIHRDVKPDNILLRPDGQVKLADLGLVKRLETEVELTRTGRGLGTPHFMAPEQFRNAKGADIRCDVYSVGATLYMMVTGELPFQARGPFETWTKKVKGDLAPAAERAPGLSSKVNSAIQRAMDPDPARRPASCQEFADELLGRLSPRVSSGGQSGDLWYLVYRDYQGETHTIKGSDQSLRRTLIKGQCGDISLVRASRSKSGPYEPLNRFEEFHDLLNLGLADQPLTETVATEFNLGEPRANREWVMMFLFLAGAALVAAVAGHLMFRMM